MHLRMGGYYFNEAPSRVRFFILWKDGTLNSLPSFQRNDNPHKRITKYIQEMHNINQQQLKNFEIEGAFTINNCSIKLQYFLRAPDMFQKRYEVFEDHGVILNDTTFVLKSQYKRTSPTELENEIHSNDLYRSKYIKDKPSPIRLGKK